MVKFVLHLDLNASALVCLFSLGTLRSTTAMSTKTSPQNIALLYHKSFAIIPSCSLLTIWAKCPKNKLVSAVTK